MKRRIGLNDLKLLVDVMDAHGKPLVEVALLVAAVCLVVFSFLIGSAYLTPKTFASTPSPQKRCRSLPTVVVDYGLSLHVVDHELYLCFQQGGGQGMTEITCTPMKDC